MKNFTIIACLCFVSTVYAGNDKQSSKDDLSQAKLSTKLHEADIKTVEIRNTYVFNKDLKTEDLQAQSSEYAFLSKRILSEKELRQMVEMSWKEQLDSIIGVENSTGQKISRQYFTFDEKGNPAKRINSLWDIKTNSWKDAEISEFVCDEDGYVTSQLAYAPDGSDGQRYDYEYDDRKWGTALISFTLKKGEWIPNMRGEYVYDDRGNIIQETQFAYDATSPSSPWTPVIRNKGAWDEKGRQLLFEPYEWDGSDWTGNTVSEKKEYEWDENGNSTLVISSIWDTDTNDWFRYCRREQDFLNSDSQHLIRAEKKFFNKELNNWGGDGEINGYVYHNTKGIIEYDELGREIYNAAYTAYTNNEYTITAELFTVWTALPESQEASMQSVCTSTLYPQDREPYINDITTERFNSQGNKTYVFEKHIGKTQTLENYLERNWEYDDQQREITYIEYKFDKNDNSKKLGVRKQMSTYDEHGNIAEYKSQIGQNTGADDWVNNTYFTYAYEQDSILVERKAYIWNGVEYFPNWGNGCTYDYSIPISEVNMWPGANTFHKISETQTYTGVDGEWDYISFKYHYSEVKGTGIANRTDDEAIKVYPNPVVDMLYINSKENAEINLYNLQGAKLLNTNEKKIDMTSYPAGLYIIDINGEKTKVLKK